MTKHKNAYRICGCVGKGESKGKNKEQKRTYLTWQMGDVGGQQLGSLLFIALLRDVT